MKWTIATLASAIREKKISPKEIFEESLRRAKKNSNKSVFIKLTTERAEFETNLAQNRADKGTLIGVLDGLPVAFKDSFEQKDEITSAGSIILKDNNPAEKDAELVSLLCKNGSVFFGRCNMTEFSFSGLGMNPHYGTPSNPFSKNSIKIPGGSSSGSALAVAKNITPFAIGNDTSGSVRIPAAFNNLVGFRPTFSRVSIKGIYPLSPSLDCGGAITHTVQDMKIVQQIIDPYFNKENVDEKHIIKNKLLYIPDGVLISDLEPCVAKNFEQSIKNANSLGFKVIYKKFDSIEQIVNVVFKKYGTLVGLEAYITLEKFVTNNQLSELLDPFVKQRLLESSNKKHSDLFELYHLRKKIITLFKLELGNALLLLPTVPITAPEITPLSSDYKLYSTINQMILRNTMIMSFLNSPSIAIPNGFNHQGMPTSLMVSGVENNDEIVMTIGKILEL